MKAERPGSGRLPDDVVLTDARAGPSAKSGANPADLSLEHDAGDGRVGFPSIANLARPVLWVAPFAPIPFIRFDAGGELASKKRFEARARQRDLLRREEALDDDEPVLVPLLDLRRGQLEHIAIHSIIR